MVVYNSQVQTQSLQQQQLTLSLQSLLGRSPLGPATSR